MDDFPIGARQSGDSDGGYLATGRSGVGIASSDALGMGVDGTNRVDSTKPVQPSAPAGCRGSLPKLNGVGR